MVDDMCFIRSMHTEAINHEPAITYMQTGNQITGRPCLGSWAVVWLGLAERQPADVRGAGGQADQHRAGAGHFGPAVVRAAICRANIAGVSFRSSGDPILYINNPAGVPTDVRRQTLDGLAQLNEMTYRRVGDPETHARIQQYELAFRMQSSVPELTSMADEPDATYELYGEEAKKPGTFAHTRAVGPADGRARRAVRADLSSTTGTRTATSPAGCRCSARTSTNPATP